MPREKPSGSRRVHHESGEQLEVHAVAPGGELRTAARHLDADHVDAIAIVHTGALGLLDEMMIDVRAQPMRVGKRVGGAGRDEQSLGVQPAVLEELIGMMAVEREPALEAAPHFREVPEPTPVRREVITVGEAVPQPDALEREIRQRRRRLTDRESRMRSALEQHDVVTEHREDSRDE